MTGSNSDFLAINLLNEGQTVTYRSLSRALKVHSNVAKQTLYEFYCHQNTEKPGSLHATYLLTGKRLVPRETDQSSAGHQDGDDTHMRSSPLPASSAPQAHENESPESTSIRVVTLVKEEQLDEAKAGFDELLSIHIYSLEPGTIKDLEVLTDCNHKIAVEFASEDPLEFWKKYGIIQNGNVKRRTARRPAPPPSVPVVPVKASKPVPSLVPKQDVGPKGSHIGQVATKSESLSSKSTPEPEQATTANARRSNVAKPPTVKREVSSIFKSFAKAKAKPPTPAAGDSQELSQTSTPAEDDTMGGLSDEEADAEDSAMLDEGAVDAPAGKSKREREEELLQMMEVDDETIEDAPAEAEDSAPAPDKDGALAEEDSEPAETVTVSDGRRRGRRRVMKKKTVKDEEGYLVTKEEAAWESFSEDEPVPKKAKISAPVPAATKSKKTASKPGQGNIMSFFKKA